MNTTKRAEDSWAVCLAYALVGFALAVVVVFLLSACDDGTEEYRDQDCDTYEIRDRDDDCGYWDATGQYVLWYWVTPNLGGYRPDHWRPSVPNGASTVKPPNAKPYAPSLQKPPPGAPPARAVTPPRVNAPPPPARYNPPPPRYNPPPARGR